MWRSEPLAGPDWQASRATGSGVATWESASSEPGAGSGRRGASSCGRSMVRTRPRAVLEASVRAGWLDRFLTLRSAWSAVSDEQFEAFNSHNRASDFPETASRWLEMGREAGF